MPRTLPYSTLRPRLGVQAGAESHSVLWLAVVAGGYRFGCVSAFWALFAGLKVSVFRGGKGACRNKTAQRVNKPDTATQTTTWCPLAPRGGAGTGLLLFWFVVLLLAVCRHGSRGWKQRAGHKHHSLPLSLTLSLLACLLGVWGHGGDLSTPALGVNVEGAAQWQNGG